MQAGFTELPTLTFRVQFDRLIIENNQEVWFPFIFSESKRTFLCNFLLFLRKIGELIQKVFITDPLVGKALRRTYRQGNILEKRWTVEWLTSK